MSALHDAALDYAARGWAVFPLKERDKVPAVAGGFKVATTDEEEIDAAWEHRPALNVGIATGSMSGGLIVIDLDVHEERGEDGTDALWEWEREHGELPETVSAKTGSGGVHLYYQANTPISSSVNTTLGVDVRRTHKLLVLLASLMAGTTIAVSGTIGFVGLMVPHFTRLLVGSDHKKVLPVAALLGGVLVV